MPQAPRSWLHAARARTGLIVAALVLLGLLVGSTLLYRPTPDDPKERPTSAAWRVLGVDPLPQDFGDLRSVTHRWPCARDGQNSYLDGQCDPWNRKFNYPRVWLAPAALGLGAEATRPIAWIEIALAFCALWTLFPARTRTGHLFVGLIALSTPVMFAVERGNVDLLIFAALVLGLRATRSLPADRRDAARGALFAILAFLKLFPIAAFVSLARSPARLVWAGAGVGLSAVGLAIAYRGDLALLQANTMHEFVSNYGRLTLFAVDPAADAWRSPQAVTSLVYGGLIGAVAAAFGYLRRDRIVAHFGDLLAGDYETDLAAAGLAIFGLTFLIGLNYDYRLIFLLPVFPLLLSKDGGRWRSPAALAACLLLGRLLLAHWWPFFWMGIVDWAVFGAAVAWFTASVAQRYALAERMGAVAAMLPRPRLKPAAVAPSLQAD